MASARASAGPATMAEVITFWEACTRGGGPSPAGSEALRTSVAREVGPMGPPGAPKRMRQGHTGGPDAGRMPSDDDQGYRPGTRNRDRASPSAVERGPGDCPT